MSSLALSNAAIRRPSRARRMLLVVCSLRAALARTREADLDVLLVHALLHLGGGGECATVGLAQGIGEEATRPQAAHFDHVHLCGEDRELRPQIEPSEQTEYEREDSVPRSGPLELVVDVEAAEILQQLPHHGGDYHPWEQLAPTEIQVGQQFER